MENLNLETTTSLLESMMISASKEDRETALKDLIHALLEIRQEEGESVQDAMKDIRKQIEYVFGCKK